MMQTYRPGVYYQYQLAYRGTQRRPKAGILCCGACKGAEAGAEQYVPVKIESKDQLEQRFPQAENLRLWAAAGFWLDQGAALWLIPATVDGTPPRPEDYEKALARAPQIGEAACLLCDSEEERSLLAVKSAVEQALKQQRAWLGFGFCPAAEASARAAALNSERMVLCCQRAQAAHWAQGEAEGFFTCAALAARVAALPAPNTSLNSLPLPELTGVQALSEEEVERALSAGVTVFEEVGGVTECIRGVTTRTSARGEEDRSLGAITTVLMIDHVMQTVRNRLKGLLQGAQTDRYTLEAIGSQAALALGEEQELGLVASFQAPEASRAEEDPSVCRVLLRFSLAAVVSQIWITAEITV